MKNNANVYLPLTSLHIRCGPESTVTDPRRQRAVRQSSKTVCVYVCHHARLSPRSSANTNLCNRRAMIGVEIDWERDCEETYAPQKGVSVVMLSSPKTSAIKDREANIGDL